MNGDLRHINIFIGYDEREAIAYHVACQSIIENTTHSRISISPLRTDKLQAESLYYRSVDPKSSNAFSYTRFLVPYLSDYKGVSIYMDPDMIVKGDIRDLFNSTDLFCPVSVVKHKYEPKRDTKYFGARQYSYPRKNWSSMMVFHNPLCSEALTVTNVNTKSPQWLHRFEWAEDDLVGELPLEWNWLVGEYDHNDDAKLLHYTNGIPAIDGFEKSDHAEEWWYYHDRLQRARK